MPQAVVDPEEVRQFARSLKKFTGDLRDRLTVVNNHLTTLGGTWRDQEHKKFIGRFEDHTKHLFKFLEENDQHVRYLLKKADQIDQYLA
jgi:uncharacterized protein YukE